MKTIKYQGSEERTILTGMIVNDRILAKIHSHLSTTKAGPFRSKWCNLVSKWCLQFFAKYERAPRQAILALFKDFATKSNDEDSIGLVETFLGSLNEDYKAASKELNEDFVIDLAAKHFNKTKLEKLRQEIESSLEANDTEEAAQLIANYSPFRIATTEIVDLFSDESAIKDAFTETENDVLVRFPGALGEFYGSNFCRDGFVSFLAPEKKGKTWYLLDVAWRSAVNNKRRTLYYSVGDMSQRQMIRRFGIRAAKHPMKAEVLAVPTSIRKPRNGEPVVVTDEKTFKNKLTYKQVKDALIHQVQMKTAHKTSLLKLRCTPNSTTQVAHIDQEIEELTRGGWIPDVVIIDYADILMPEPGTTSMEFRHQIDATWRAMRRLSQKHHVLVVTATQSDSASYETKLLHRKNFSEDKRKFAHVTGMVGINQTDEEKEQGIYRLNWILLREEKYVESKCVTVAGSLALGRPAMVSCW